MGQVDSLMQRLMLAMTPCSRRSTSWQLQRCPPQMLDPRQQPAAASAVTSQSIVHCVCRAAMQMRNASLYVCESLNVVHAADRVRRRVRVP